MTFYFDPDATPPLGELDRLRFSLVSILLCGSVVLFSAADLAIILYGPAFPAAPLIMFGVVAVCLSVPITYFLSRRSASSSDLQSLRLYDLGDQSVYHLWVGTLVLHGWPRWSDTLVV